MLKLLNGAKRIRTADLLNAIETRYQLCYSPMFFPSSLELGESVNCFRVFHGATGSKFWKLLLVTQCLGVAIA